jgi:hypothetical protein
MQSYQGVYKATLYGAVATNIVFGNVIQGQWTHCVFTFDSASKVFASYTNGVLSKTFVLGNQITWEGGTHYPSIGGSSTGLFSKGIIDDARIYSRALNATEVLQLYNNGHPMP